MRRLLFLLPLFFACTITTKQQGTVGIRVLAGEWGIELYHQTPDTDEASANLNFDKTVMDWVFDSDNDGEMDMSGEPDTPIE